MFSCSSCNTLHPIISSRLVTLPVPKPATISITQIQNLVSLDIPLIQPLHIELVVVYSKFLSVYMSLSLDI